MKIEVTLSEYLSGNCKYKGCSYNDLGICTNEDQLFIDGIHDIVEDLDGNEDKNKIYIDCDPDINYDYCLHCGTKLKIDRTYLPYGSTYARLETTYCPKCD